MIEKFYTIKAKELENKIEKNLSEEELFSFVEFDDTAAEDVSYSNYSYWGSTLRIFLKNKVALAFSILIIIILVFSFIQPYLPNQVVSKATEILYDESGYIARKSIRPNKEFWFGTNSIGQDLWSMIWSGTRTSIYIGFSVACFEALVGIVIGVLWGYSRKLNFLFTGIYNIFDNIPQTIVLVIMSYILRPGVKTIIFAMCLTGWLATARFVRNQVIIIRDRDYNLASNTLGTPLNRIITKNLLPYLVSVIMLRMALAIPAAISNEIFITYIGLGVPVDTPTLGNLLNSSRKLITSPMHNYQLFVPVIVISIITISFYIIGNTFADSADPKNHI